jgi:hypothetical protein
MDIIGALILIAALAFVVFVVMVGLGAARLSKRNEQHAYVMHVLHNVEAKRALDIENGYL